MSTPPNSRTRASWRPLGLRSGCRSLQGRIPGYDAVATVRSL